MIRPAREADVPVIARLIRELATYETFLAKPGMYLEDLFVMPHARGRGHGKALFKAVAGIAVERGCGRMEWSVLDWNQPAIDFYLAWGATTMSDWTVFRLTGESLVQAGA
jgi:GNAT superfamily N-acetyltransferase